MVINQTAIDWTVKPSNTVEDFCEYLCESNDMVSCTKTTIAADNLRIGSKAYDLKGLEKKVFIPPEVSPNTKSRLVERDGKLVAIYYKDGYKTGEKVIMPAITGVEVVQNTIIMRFADKTKTKATFDTDGEFSLEDGISVCITKKLLGQEGSSLYNKLIEKALKTKAKNEADAAKAQQEAEEAKRRKAKYQAQREKKKQRKREEAIAIQAEAYARAMRMIAEENKK